MNSAETPFDPNHEVTPDEQMEADFTTYVDAHNYTSAQVQEAYYRLMGETVDLDTDVPPELLEEMQRLLNQHFPLNRFAQFIEIFKTVEAAVPIYDHFVEDLTISEKEKRMLRSLVKKNRVGELEIFFWRNVGSKSSAQGCTGRPARFCDGVT